MRDYFASQGELMKYITYLLLLTILGCTSVQQYEGNKKPDDEISILTKPKDNIIISHINGNHRGLGTSDRYDFLPGQTTLTVGYIASNSSTITSTKPIDLIVKFEAGKRYTLKYSLSNRSWKAWVIDAQSGKVVSK
jgi:hypothetical protein